jgi:N-acetylglucosaminyldiphosphoundecaprenol N-acetyl-beta-D-mannosaminyltransferase
VGVVKDLGKRNVLGVLVDAADHEGAVARVLAAARERRPLACTALAVHGVMTGVDDPVHRYRLNHFDLATPDGQPVRWALNWLYGAGLARTTHGSGLMLGVCERAAEERLPIYLYGSTQIVLDRLVLSLRRRFPSLAIAGSEPSKFRRTSTNEKQELVERVHTSGAAIVFIGLGCPRQEVFAYEYRDALGIPTLAVGAAFDYLAGELREPHPLVRRAGFEWLHRLILEPRRLWRRYVLLNPRFLWGLGRQLVGLSKPMAERAERPTEELLYG